MRRTWSEIAIVAIFVAVLLVAGFMVGWGSRGLYEENPKGTEAVNLPLTPVVDKPVFKGYRPIF